MKIVSWNIRQGGGTRIRGILRKIKEHDAEIVILSEFQNGKRGDEIKVGLDKLGYNYIGTTQARSRLNSVVIASKFKSDFTSFENEIEDFPQSILQMNLDDLVVYGVYLPHKKKHQLFPFLFDRIVSQQNVVIAGDYNSGINGLDQKGSSFWYEDELKKLISIGYTDAFRVVNGMKEDYSWYSHQGNGYRYDHSWMNISLAKKIISCDYDHDSRISKLSDHSLMYVEIEL